MLGRLLALLSLALLLGSVGSAYGHGLGFDETPPVVLAGKQVSVEATLAPSFIEGVASGRPVMTVRAHDPVTNATIAGMDYRVAVEFQGAVVLDQRFASEDGLVLAELTPDRNADVAQVNGRPASSTPVQVNSDSPAEIRSRILTDGGLYHIAVTLEKTSVGLDLEDDRTFDLYVSVSKTRDFQVDTPGGPQTMSVRSYYADVGDFAYDPEGGMSFSMPFDWSAGYVSQVPLVHVEVQFPKAVEGLQSNGYRGSVNGRELPADAILIDDYAFEDKRVVHFVISADRLASIATVAEGDSMDFVLLPVEKPKFPLDILSTTEKYLWQLAWDPEIIRTGGVTTFIMNLQDRATGDLLRNSSFDLVLEKDGREVHRQRLTSGLGTFSYDYVFAEPGTYRLAAVGINGGSEKAQLDIVVLQGTGTAPPPDQKSGCLIATAAFGSEIAPQVQLLRGFRDDYILKSESGSAFIDTFNAVYYSFSPQVADYEREQPWLQGAVRAGLYPLIGILLASERAFSTVGGGEAGAILAGWTASSLVGAVYLSPAAAVLIWKRRAGIRPLAVTSVAAAGALATTLIALYAGLPLLFVTTPAFVLASASAAVLAVAWVAGRLR